MNSFGVKHSIASHRIQFMQNMRTGTGCFTRADQAKMIPPITDTNVQSFFYLPQIFIKLATEIGQDFIVGWLKQELPGFDCSVQELNVGYPHKSKHLRPLPI